MRLTIVCCLTPFALLAAACGSDSAATAPIRDAARVDAASVPAVDIALTGSLCGTSVIADLRLEEDLTCAGDGLIVNADGVKIDLNAHSITGAGAGVGITVRSHQNISIIGGTIRGFASGVFVATSSEVVIKHNGFTANREGVFLAGATRISVTNNAAWENTLRGIMIRPTGSGTLSTDNVILGNVISDNPSGILLFGQPGNTLIANSISGSSVAGIDLTGGGAAGNTVRGNLLTNNAAGIRFGPGWTGNTFAGNRIRSNTCGIQGTTADNTFNGIVFSANVADWCP